jgi:hypothetical protein
MALIRIRKEIEIDLTAMQRVIEEYASIPTNTEEWVKIRTKASLLHDFYTGIERICARIAQELNGGIPKTEQWHRDLLKDMSLDLEGVRPPVISETLYMDLLPYLRFRHLFRNLYGFELEWKKLSDLDLNFPKVAGQWFEEVRVFLDWMKSIAEI